MNLWMPCMASLGHSTSLITFFFRFLDYRQRYSTFFLNALNPDAILMEIDQPFERFFTQCLSLQDEEKGSFNTSWLCTFHSWIYSADLKSGRYQMVFSVLDGPKCIVGPGWQTIHGDYRHHTGGRGPN